MTTQTMTPGSRAYAFLRSESPGQLSRESAVIQSGAGALVSGSVLARITKRQAASPIPTIVGTGTGVMTVLKFGPDVQVGSYVITLTETSSTAAFTVVAPDGTSLPNGAVGTAYTSNHLSFLISDGGTMTAADAFTVVVTAAGTPVVVGTGDGTIGSITLGKLAQLGTYVVKNVLAATNSGTWDVIAPDGSTVGHGIITAGAGGTLVFTSDHVNFTITDGSTDFALGDYFNIIVAGYATEATKLAVLWDPTAVNGSQEAWGILADGVDASSATQDATAIVRNAEVDSPFLTWKSTVTAAQKIEAERQLAANGIQFRA